MKYTKLILPLILVCTVFAKAEPPTSPPYSPSFTNASLGSILKVYERITGKQVERVSGTGAIMSFKAKDLSQHEYCELIETKLAEHNIGLFLISSNRVVATWLDPTIDNDHPKNTLEYIQRGVMELKTHFEQLDPPPSLPDLSSVKLTPEMDALLFKEGILPPLKQKGEPVQQGNGEVREKAGKIK